MEDRKRRLQSPLPAGGSAQQKRKLVASGAALSSSSISAGGKKEGEEDDREASEPVSLDASFGLEEGFLETFTKAAMYRQMQEYKRELERTLAKAQRVDDDCRTSQARLAGIEESWKQITAELKASLGNEEEMEPPNGHIDSEDADQEQDPVLQRRIRETRHLLRLLARPSSAANSSKDLASRYETVSAQLVESRSSHTLLQSLLSRTQAELEETITSLRSLERAISREKSGHDVLKRFERTHMGVAHADTPAPSSPAPAAPERHSAPKPEISGADMVMVDSSKQQEATMKEVKMEGDEEEVQQGSSGLTRAEIQQLQLDAEDRAKEAKELREEKVALINDLDSLKLKIAGLPEELVAETPPYRVLNEQVSKLESSLKSSTEELATLQEETVKLRSAQTDLKALLDKEARGTIEDLTKRSSQLQSEVVRLRSERDARLAELQELKVKESERYRGHDQMKILAESRQKRINALLGEVKRLKLKAAADTGDMELVQLVERTGEPSAKEDQASLASSLPEDEALHTLKARIKEQDNLILTFRKRLEDLSGTTDQADLDMAAELIQNEANAKAEVEAVRAKLLKLEGLVNSSAMAPDQLKITERLEQDEQVIAKLEANLKVAEMSMQMLITEVTRLSEAWDVLNTQNQGKVFSDILNHDKNLERHIIEKSKSTQKYFASEREKEALAANNAALSRVRESQKLALVAAEEERILLLSKITNFEQEVAEQEKKLKEYTRQADNSSQEKAKAEGGKASAEKQLAETRTLLRDRTAQCDVESASKKRLEADNAKLSKDVEKWKSKATSAIAAAKKEGRYVEGGDKMYTKNLEAMLQCSSCHTNFKSHTITRCFHMFCKDCIEARLETRQRKCPSCSIGFGAHDVQQLYFQSG